MFIKKPFAQSRLAEPPDLTKCGSVLAWQTISKKKLHALGRFSLLMEISETWETAKIYLSFERYWITSRLVHLTTFTEKMLHDLKTSFQLGEICTLISRIRGNFITYMNRGDLSNRNYNYFPVINIKHLEVI